MIEDESELPMSFSLVTEEDGPELLVEEYLPLIEKVRQKCREYRKSAMKNEAFLQEHVVKAHGKERHLILDCKTRWNTLIAMIKRFILLHKEIRLATLMNNKPWDFRYNFLLLSLIHI